MREARRVGLVLAGYGTVGKALHEAIDQRAAAILDEEGIDLRVTAIARRDRVCIDPEGLPYKPSSQLPWKTGSAMDLLWENAGDVLCELTPTNLADGQPGLGHVRTAIHQGIPAVLANKGPVVVAHKELQERADEAGVPLRFEATVGGCVPTLSAVRHSFAGDRLLRVEGILNGTTNFILTRMATEGSDLEQVLREAQELGYAEADPSADIDGLDAAAKVVILANALLGQELTLDEVEVTGIRGVTRQAVELARDHGFHIKLVAEASLDGTARVGPRLVPVGSTLDVAGVLNAVRFTTELAGTVTHVGHGAGGRATAAAVLSDVIDVCRTWHG